MKTFEQLHERLSPNGESNVLYQTRFGAHTKESYEEMIQAEKRYYSYIEEQRLKQECIIPISDELAIRNEKCIEEHGVSIWIT